MITVKSRGEGQRRWTTREFATQAEADAYGRKLAPDHSIVWAGKAEAPDAPAATRAMWTGMIAFGMVAAPVKLFAATEDGTPPLKMLCAEHGTPVSFRRSCEQGHEIGEGGTVKGVRNDAGGWTALDESELDRLPQAAKKTANVQTFIPAGSVPAIYQDRCYFLTADKGGSKPYALLAEALAATGREAIARIVLRDREHLCVIRSNGELLTLTTLHWAAEVRTSDRLPKIGEAATVTEAERVLARQLVEAMSTDDFNATDYRDEYAAALAELVSEKAATVTRRAKRAPAPSPPADEFLSALTATVERLKKEKVA